MTGVTFMDLMSSLIDLFEDKVFIDLDVWESLTLEEQKSLIWSYKKDEHISNGQEKE